MAKRFCSAAGSNTSPYDTWAKAATTFTTAITGIAAGDIIAVDVSNPPAGITTSTSWGFGVPCSVIASTNSGTATITPSLMADSSWLGSSGATSYAISINATSKVYFYGITFRIAGSTGSGMFLNNTTGHIEYEKCYLWAGPTGAGSIICGNTVAGLPTYTLFKNCTFRFGSTTAIMTLRSADVLGGGVSTAGSAPASLLSGGNSIATARFTGVDLSHITGTLVASQAASNSTYEFAQCKFGAGVVVMAAQTPATKASARVWAFDCASGNAHGMFGYYDAFGSVTSSTGIYVTAGAAAQSWKVVTTAACSFGHPFVTPWVSLYNTATTAITPRLEILRDGSPTAYTDAEVWGEFSVKDNSGFTHSDTFSDRQALVDWVAGTSGTALAAGAGTGSWTGGTTPWSGKVDSGSAITPAESGHIRARVAVGAPSITVYVDPQIRT